MIKINTEIINKIFIVIYLIVINIITILFYNNIYNRKKNNTKDINKIKNNIKNESNNKKIILKKISKILLISCNTFLYCVLYIKVGKLYLFLYTLYFLLLIYISLYDMKYKIISNKSNMILLLLSTTLFIVDNINTEMNFITNIKVILIGLLIKYLIVFIIFLILLLIRKIFKNNIGGGDIKMLSAIFIYLNLDKSISMILYQSITSLITALYLLIIKKKSKDYKLPYGEFISLGTIITILIYGGN